MWIGVSRFLSFLGALILPFGLSNCAPPHQAQLCDIWPSPSSQFQAMTERTSDSGEPRIALSVCSRANDCESVALTTQDGRLAYYWADDTLLVVDTDGKRLSGRPSSPLKREGLRIQYDRIVPNHVPPNAEVRTLDAVRCTDAAA